MFVSANCLITKHNLCVGHVCRPTEDNGYVASEWHTILFAL